MVASGPVAVTIEQRTDDAAVEHALESLVMRLGLPSGDQLVSLDEALDAQPLRVRRAAPEANVVWRVAILQALFLLPCLVLMRRS